MRLSVATPLAIVVEADDVTHVRAEDETGAFGILTGHADFLTVLAVSVLSWRDGSGVEHHVAVRGGALEVRSGDTIAVATPEATPGDDLGHLESDVLAGFRRRLAEEQAARTDAFPVRPPVTSPARNAQLSCRELCLTIPEVDL